jgi:hypothetical protein
MLSVYQKDVVAWAKEQANLLRAKRFDLLDIENIAGEIEDVGRSEQRELASRMVILLFHLLKWEYQAERRGASWEKTIKIQRSSVLRRIEKTPSLKSDLNDADWWADVWGDAIICAQKETGISYDVFPDSCPWSIAEILDINFFPN